MNLDKSNHVDEVLAPRELGLEKNTVAKKAK